MTQTVEIDLGKILERIEQKLDRFIETTQKDLTEIKINQVRLEGKVETLQVEVQNSKEDIRELKTEIKDKNKSMVENKSMALPILKTETRV